MRWDIERNPHTFLSNTPGGVQSGFCPQSPDPHWEASLIYSPGGMFCVSLHPLGGAEHKTTFSKEPPLLSTSSFWVWAALSTTPTLWSLSKNWVSIFKELWSLPPSSMCTVNFAAKLVHTRRALSSTIINSHKGPVSGQACNPPDPHWFLLSFSRWRSFMVLGTKMAPIP